MRPTVGSVLNVAPDPRWTHAVLRWEPFKDARANGDKPDEWTCRFVGWATVVRWVGDGARADEYETEVEPVVLEDEGYVSTLSDLQRASTSTDKPKGLYRLVRLLAEGTKS